MRFPAAVAALGALLAPVALPAADPAPSAPPPPVLLGPEVVKLDWNTRALVAHDLDGDGRRDLALINNGRASIELLFQRDPASPEAARSVARSASTSAGSNRWEPELEDARFRKETLIVGQNLFDLVIADFNGDGRADLAATGEPVSLLLRLARADGTWDEKTYATAPSPVRFLGGLAAADIDGDGLSDLVMLGQKEIALFRQRPGQGLVLEEKIPLGDDNPYGLLVADYDGDGRVDLGYLVPGGREALRLRRQIAPGKFGPELAFALKTPRSPLVQLDAAPLTPVATAAAGGATAPTAPAGKRRAGPRAETRGGATAAASSVTDTATAPLFASALGTSGQVEFSRLVPAESDDRWRGFAPRAYTPLAGARGPALYATGDFNRDDASDLAVAFGETAQVFLYLRDSDGGFALAERIPSLTDARALGALASRPGRAADRLLVLSGKENALAEIELGRDGVARPPRALPVPGRLITFAAGTLAEDRPGFALVAEEEGKRTLSLWTRGEDGEPLRGASLPLAGVRTDPRSALLGDLDQDGLADVLLVVPSAGVRVYLQKPDGTLADAADNPAYRPGLLGRSEAATSPLSWGDVDGDGRDELLVGAENFVRALRIDADGELVIAAQFDARDNGAEVTTGFVLPGGEKADVPRVILHDRKADQLHLLERPTGAAAHETVDVRDVARMEVAGALRMAGPKGRLELLLLGRDRFWWMPEGASDFALKSEGAYASDLPDVRYFYLADGDFDADGRDDIVAIDINQNMVELLGRDGEGEWRPRLHFKVFETDPHYEGNRGGGQEPRECIVADVTGDDRADLVLLVHDRVLVYPQETLEPK